jgi:mono/diheme cytochrome c family protein
MNLHRNFFAAAVLVFAAGIFAASAQSNAPVATMPVYVPDYTHAGEPLPDGVIAWDALLKAVDTTNEQDFARFVFEFTNVTTAPVTILMVHPSCGCTTAELPPTPWTIPAGGNGEIKLSVNLQGKSGTLFKTVNVSTDHGKKDLMLRINVAPPAPMPEMTDAQRDAGIAAAKVDREAIFKGDCASCHLKKVDGKYGQQLFEALCAICHEAKNRATMVPDLANLQIPTNEEFWRAWITSGKAGSLMPAFATSQGGPLNDLQIASLAAYLNAIHPSKVAPGTVKWPPPVK